MARSARQIEREVGHPGDMWDALKYRIQSEAIVRFEDIRQDWLDLMWALDMYRKESVTPTRMRKSDGTPLTDIGAIMRGKGNWFADIVALLLTNRTTQELGSRSRVRGFSQVHQIDVAWPVREIDPLICAETKVTGGPPYGSRKARGATNDWTNRRKELKFAATDLKLYRRRHETQIDHWGAWRNNQPPKTYFLWAARLGPSDRIDRMVDEVRALADTYLDGAGVFGWRENANETAYEVVPLPAAARAHDLDDVLHRIASEIRDNTGSDNEPPPPVEPPPR